MKLSLILKKRKLKIIGLIIFLGIFTASAFSQQFLWSTAEGDSLYQEYVPLISVTKEVTKFYDHYDHYYDLAGFSKERFMEEIDFGFEDWLWLNDIKNPTVFAVRSNEGDGSIVLVMCVSEDNINLIIFSNHTIDYNTNYESTYSNAKEKFEKWFKTLLN
jgi:hypothetical protein